MMIALAMWLFGNFWWMYGEVEYNDDYVYAPTGGYCFEFVLCWILLYHVLWQPLGFLKHDMEEGQAHAEEGLVPRFKYFKTWRQYELAHIFFWCGKDWSW